MSSRPYLAPYPVFTSQTMAASATSQATNIQTFAHVSYTIVWTGTPTGDFSVEVSNDFTQNPDGSPRNAGTWVPITLSDPVAAAGSANSAFINIKEISAAYIRLVYTRTSGTGVLNATIAGKAS